MSKKRVVVGSGQARVSVAEMAVGTELYDGELVVVRELKCEHIDYRGNFISDRYLMVFVFCTNATSETVSTQTIFFLERPLIMSLI